MTVVTSWVPNSAMATPMIGVTFCRSALTESASYGGKRKAEMATTLTQTPACVFCS